MRPGYSSRQLRAGIARHTVPEPPAPTRADLEASLYWQAWESATARGRYEILVLGIDDDDAHAAGARRIEKTYGPGALGELRLVAWQRVADAPLDWGTLRPMLEGDSQAERDARRHAWEARSAPEAGP